MTATEKNKNVPELRFPEFEGEWVEKKLGEIASFSKGKGISKDDIKPDGELECIRYGELYTHYSEVIDKIKSKTNVNVKNLILSELNDVIIPASGETQIDIATASCVLKKGVALGGDLNIIKSSLDGIFLSYYVNNKKKKEIASLAQGNSIVHLYSNQLKTLHVNVPVEPEQQKIATFLTGVDKRIHLLTQKKEKLEQYKKGLMQKLFSRELRFKDENGNHYPEWEEKRLGEIINCLDSKRKPLNEAERNKMKGSIPYWGANNIMDYVNDFIFNETIVLLAEDGGYFDEFQNRPIAQISYGKCWVNNHAHVLKAIKSEVISEYLYYSLVHKNILGYVNSGTRSKLNKSDMLMIKMTIPSLPEQQKIASFLSAIDKQIEQVARQIEHSNQWKKGLLQKMFV